MNHRLMYYFIRPLVRRLPVAVFAAAAMSVAVVIGTLRAVSRASYYRRILDCCGRPDVLPARIGLAVRSMYAKARHLDWYIYERTPRLVATWDGEAEDGPCIYITCHTYGTENVDKWLDRYDAVLVRLAFAGEGQLDLATATPGQKWRAHQAHLRQRHAAATGRHVIVGQGPMAYRRLLDGRRSMILLQDLHDPKRADGPPMLGVPVTLRMGALKIAKLTGGLPVRYMTIRPRGASWHIHVGPRIPATYDAIASAIEADIRSRPAEWMLWRDFFEYADGGLAPVADQVATERPGELMPHLDDHRAEPQAI